MINKIRQMGFRHFLETYFNRLVPAWVFRYSVGDLFELDTARLSALCDELDMDEFQFKCVVAPKERKRLRRRTWNSVKLSTTQNDQGYAILDADEPDNIFGGVWGGVESFLESNLGFQMEFVKNEAWIYCAFVSPKARGKGVYKRALAFSSRDLLAKGFDRQLVVVQPWNKASWHIHNKYSQLKLGRIRVIRVFGLSAVFTKGRMKKSKTITTQPETNPVSIRVT